MSLRVRLVCVLVSWCCALTSACAASSEMSTSAQASGMSARPHFPNSPVSKEGPTLVADAAPGVPPRPVPAPMAPPSGQLGKAGAASPAGEGAAEETAQVAEPSAPARKGQHPLLIYTAHLRLAVFEADKSIDAVEQLTQSSGGYLVNRNDTSITVRVPANHFQRLLERVSKLGDELHRDVNVRDVTDEYLDLEIRLKNAEAVRVRLSELLSRAQTVEEALAVERELSRITFEIESLKGRLKRLGELIAYSTITVTFQAQPIDRVESTVKLPFPWLNQLGLGSLLNL